MPHGPLGVRGPQSGKRCSVPSVLKFGHLFLSSQGGAQQGDPLGPLLFSLPFQQVLQSLESDFKLGFLDDVTLGGEMETMVRDVQVVARLGPRLGLHLNPTKYEFFSPDATLDLTPPLSNYSRLEVGGLSLLGPLCFG